MMRLSFGLRPVFVPDSKINAPLSEIADSFSNDIANLYNCAGEAFRMIIRSVMPYCFKLKSGFIYNLVFDYN